MVPVTFTRPGVLVLKYPDVIVGSATVVLNESEIVMFASTDVVVLKYPDVVVIGVEIVVFNSVVIVAFEGSKVMVAVTFSGMDTVVLK